MKRNNREKHWLSKENLNVKRKKNKRQENKKVKINIICIFLY